MTVVSQHFANIAETLVKYQEHGFLCDAVLVSKCGTQLKAHSALLAAVSPVFMAALEAAQANGPHHLYFPEVELDVLQIALHFVYTGKLLLPAIYSQMDELSILLNQLSELGLDLHKLHGCEMMFLRKAKPSAMAKAQDMIISEAEHNYHKINHRDLLANRKKKIGKLSGEYSDSLISVCDRPGSTKTQMESQRSTSNFLESSFSARSSNQSKSEFKPLKKRHPVSILKHCSLQTPSISSSSSPSDLKESTSGLLCPVFDPSIGQILVLDGDNPVFWDTLVDGDGSQRKPDVLSVIDESNLEQSGFVLQPHSKEPGILNNSSKQIVYMCDFCGENDRKEFPTEFDLSWHKIKCHWNECHECNYCKRKFSSEGSLKNHIRRHLGGQLLPRRKNYRCDNCGLHFDTATKLKVHKSRHTGEKPFECQECGKQFSMPGNLERHQMLHTGFRPYLCDFCGKGFVQKWSLMDHVSMHHEDKQNYECALCNCELKSKVEMEKHALEFHQLTQLEELNSMIKKREEYLCDFCGKNFFSASSLKHHIKGHGNKPAKCDTCGKKFSTFYGLQLHMKLHTGERPFVCEICLKGFIQKTSLITHLVTHSGVKPFVCVVCSKAFSSKGQLKQHMMMHSGEKPFKCGICSKQFTYKSSLTLHNRTHTGDKPYSCTICGTSYAQLHHLRSHLRTHTGEKPFVCEICGKSYKNKIDLRYHYTRFHKLDVKKITLNARSEYIFELDKKPRVNDAPELHTLTPGSSTLDEFSLSELKPEVCK